MKKLLLFLLLIIMASSCGRNDNENRMIPTARTLAKSESFKKLTRLLSKNLENQQNLDNLKEIAKVEGFDNADTKKLISALGFRMGKNSITLVKKSLN